MSVRMFLIVWCILTNCNFIMSILCPCGYSYYKDSCYILNYYGNKVNWLDASFDCSRKGGHLAVVTDQQEQDFLWNMKGNITQFWIGLINDIASDGEAAEGSGWAWQDGSQYSWTDWYGNHPLGGADAAMIDAGDNGSSVWRGLSRNDGLNASACERPIGYENNTICSDDRCYTFVEVNKTWNEARNYCQSINLQLLARTRETPTSIRDDLESVIRDAMCLTTEKIYWIQNKHQPKLCPLLRMSSDGWSLGTDDCHDVTYNFICTRQSKCPEAWKEYNGYCYYFGESKVTMSEAEQICKANGADLLSIESTRESLFQRDISISRSGEYWMRLQQNADSGWAWKDGTHTGVPLSYSNWALGQPDNTLKCAYVHLVRFYVFGIWFSWSCQQHLNYICKRRSQVAMVTTQEPLSQSDITSYLSTSDEVILENVSVCLEDEKRHGSSTDGASMIIIILPISCLVAFVIVVALVYTCVRINKNRMKTSMTQDTDEGSVDIRWMGTVQSDDNNVNEDYDDQASDIMEDDGYSHIVNSYYQPLEGAAAANSNAYEPLKMSKYKKSVSH